MENRQTQSKELLKKLPYCHQDKHGNSLLLQAAQPLTRTDALVNLQNAIKNGTYKYNNSDAQNDTLIGQMPNAEKPIYFNENQIVADGDCGFHALGIERETLYNTLLPYTSESSSCDYIKEEIANAFFSNELITPNEEIKTLIDQYQEEQKELDAIINNAKSILNTSLSPQEQQYTSEELAEYLINKASELSQKMPQNIDVLFPTIDQWGAAQEIYIDYFNLGTAIKDKRNQVEMLRQSILLDCAQSNIFQYYLEQLRTNSNLWLGYKIAMLFAQKKMISLYIWNRVTNDESKIQSVDYFDAGENKQVIHLLHTNHFTHFNSLSEVNHSQYLDTTNHLNDTNIYGHNLLHRAVRCIAADILVPYLLNDLDFKKKVNDIDIYGKTALHRAIKYFAEEKDNIIQQLTKENMINTKEEATRIYCEIMNTCFIALVQSGADLDTIKDYEGHSVLHRADLYNAYFPWSNPNSKLSEELKGIRALTLGQQTTQPLQAHGVFSQQQTNKRPRQDASASRNIL